MISSSKDELRQHHQDSFTRCAFQVNKFGHHIYDRWAIRVLWVTYAISLNRAVRREVYDIQRLKDLEIKHLNRLSLFMLIDILYRFKSIANYLKIFVKTEVGYQAGCFSRFNVSNLTWRNATSLFYSIVLSVSCECCILFDVKVDLIGETWPMISWNWY